MRDEHKQRGSVLSIIVLIAAGTALSAAPAAAPAGGDLRLIEAAKNQDQQQVRALLSQHADVNVHAEDGSTALLWAAHWNDIATAELLLRAGADANAANAFRMTPLSLACTNASVAAVELLLKAGANPGTPIATGETPIMTCAASGNAEAVRMLIARGADVNAKEPSQNQTALMWRPRNGTRTWFARSSRPKPTLGPTRKKGSPPCTSRRVKATSKAPGCCCARA